ncbi:MAG: hypothetical protein LH603_06520 [Pseudonocardia sp.]|nr:hypothetical protein [Pseudonocardia sp.]
MAAAVTVTVAYPVTPGEEDDFEVWSRRKVAEAAGGAGYLRGEVLAPTTPGPDWLIKHRFDDERSARRWESSFRRSPEGRHATDVTWGVEHRTSPAPDPGPREAPDRWTPAALQASSAVVRPAGPPPPRWRVGIVTLLVVFSGAAAFDMAIAPTLQTVPALIRTGVLAVVVTAVLVAVSVVGRGWLARTRRPPHELRDTLTGPHRDAAPDEAEPTRAPRASDPATIPVLRVPTRRRFRDDLRPPTRHSPVDRLRPADRYT